MPQPKPVPRLPFHESVVRELRDLTLQRGAWPIEHGRTLLRLLEQTTIPTDKLAFLIEALVDLRTQAPSWAPILSPVIRRLRKYRSELLR